MSVELPIPYGRQSITDIDIDAVIDVLKSDYLTQGPKIGEFESAFAQYVGAQYAVAVSNGTAALHLSALALNVKPGSRVITTPITFVASANCVKYCGGEVEFVDIDPENHLLDLVKVEALLQSQPIGYYSGIIPVDFAGYPIDLERLRDIASRYNCWIIEDACHAPGGSFNTTSGEESKCGSGQFAELAIFSFHPVKHIATGEGGMITTNSLELYKKLLLLRTHGITKEESALLENHGGWYYEMQTLGYNYRMPDMLAALGISQLSKANEGMAQRKKIAKRYDEAFKDSSISIPVIHEGVNHAFHLYIIEVEERLSLYNSLRAKGIFAQVHYEPVHLQPYYRALGFKAGDAPVAEAYYQKCISLPMYPTLSETQQQYVIEQVLQHLKTTPSN